MADMTPKDRDELVELMAQYGSGCGRGSMWAKSNEVKKDAWRAAMERALDAMEAAGVAQVPVEPTEEIIKAMTGFSYCPGPEAEAKMQQHWEDTETDYVAAIAASPLRKEKP